MPPDFSGRWVLIAPPHPSPDFAEALTVRQSFEPSVTLLTVDRQFKSTVRTDGYRIGILGGTVPGLDRDGRTTGPSTRYGVRWEGDTLVIETGTYERPARKPDSFKEAKEIWSLGEDETLVINFAERSSGAAPRTATLTYRRK